jgi:hypothetical protein
VTQIASSTTSPFFSMRKAGLRASALSPGKG